MALDVLFLVMFILHSILSDNAGVFECGSLLSAQLEFHHFRYKVQNKPSQSDKYE